MHAACYMLRPARIPCLCLPQLAHFQAAERAPALLTWCRDAAGKTPAFFQMTNTKVFLCMVSLPTSECARRVDDSPLHSNKGGVKGVWTPHYAEQKCHQVEL